MNVYQMNEGRFVLPDGWNDQSVHLFLSGNGEFSLVVSRQPVPPGQDLDAFATGQLNELRENLSRFHLLRRMETTLDSLPAVEAEFTWVREGQSMHQHQTFVFHDQTALTLTGTTLVTNYPRYEATLQHLLASFQLGR